jgi:hypothetical protein
LLGVGKFGHGFVSAGLGKALSPLADGHGLITTGLINAAIGGTISEITGGDFANGAVMAATQYAFNALANQVMTGVPWIDDLMTNSLAGEPLVETKDTVERQFVTELSQPMTLQRAVDIFYNAGIFASPFIAPELGGLSRASAIGKTGSRVAVRTTRSGEIAIRQTRSNGSVIDISPQRVKEFVPNMNPNAPPGTMQRVKFENGLPGSKGYKRAPTPSELEILRNAK